MASLESDNFWERLGILAIIAVIMTLGVYGVVALLVKMDDLGVQMAQWPGKSLPAIGRGLVKGMPHVFSVISVVGTLAMLWVGGHIVIKSFFDIGLIPFFYNLEHSVVQAVENLGPVVTWFTTTGFQAVFGLLWGCLIVGVVVLLSRFLPKKVQH